MDPNNLSLTARDFDLNFEFLKGRVRELAPDIWNSFHEGDLGTVLMDVIAFDATLLTNIADAQFRETFLDTLRHRESLKHFSRLTGYQIRRNTPASIEAMAEANASPTSPDYLLLRRGTRVQSKDGLPWELADDYRILPGYFTPVRRVIGHGDVRARLDVGGVDTEVDALVRIRQGESFAVLTDQDGNRLPSDYNFTALVGEGNILRLTSQKIGSSFGPAPDSTRREFAVTGTGKLEFDRENNSVLYLDRPWDLTDYLGKWEIENRSVTLVQGETRDDRSTAPSTEDAVRNHVVRSTYYPVISGQAEAYIVSGLLSSPENRSGLTVSVNGTPWRETVSLLLEGPNEPAYEVDFDHLDRAVVKFGNGINGSLLPTSASLSIQYRTGGGFDGNVPQGSFDTTVAGTLVPATGSSPTVFLTNPYTVGRGGRDRETLQEAQKNIQAFVRTNDRGVSSVDYAYLASNFADPAAGRVSKAVGVLHANAVPREQNLIWVYAWGGTGNGQAAAPSMPLKMALQAYLDERKMITDEVVVLDGISVRVPLVVRYRYSRQKEYWEVGEALRAALSKVFDAQVPGGDLEISKLYEAMEAVDGLEMGVIESMVDNYRAELSHELFTNSVADPSSTRLAVAAPVGGASLVVQDGTIFYPGATLMVWEYGRTPTVSEVDSVSGNVVTLKRDLPTRDSYTLPDGAGRGARVYNSDFVARAWQFEKRVDVHVRYDTSFGGIDEIDHALAFKIRSWFDHVLEPEQPVTRAALEYLVSTTSGVTGCQVTTGTVDGTQESVSASFREKLVCGSLSINGTPY